VNYVILPPSHHRSGGTYEWALTLTKGRLAPAPDFPLSDNAGGEDDGLKDRVREGELIETGRNKAAFRFACMVARWSDDPELVEKQTQAWVDRSCRNPGEVDTAKQVKGALKLSRTASLGALPAEEDGEDDAFGPWLSELQNSKDEDELFAALAARRPPSSKLSRQQLRGRLKATLDAKFSELESGASAARTADAWLVEGGGGGDDGLQGREFVIEDIKPWSTPVVGADVLDEIDALYDSYLYTSVEARTAFALWDAFSHASDHFGVSPIMDISSPTKRCGKSTAVVIHRHLCRSPLLSGNITPAALFRAVEAWSPTLLIDEADTFAKMNDELRGILNAGHTRDTAFVVRAEGEANEPRLFSTWAPKLVAAIGRLPDTIEDRSVRVVINRKRTGDTKKDGFDPQLVRRDCEGIRRRLVRFVLDHADAIAAAQVDRPGGLNDRAWNNWRPLLAIALVAGGDWPARAKQAAVGLSGEFDDDDEDVGTLALQHVWEVVGPAGRLPTADVLHHLITKEEGPWAKWWEASVAKDELKSPAARLARLLKPFGVKPTQLWIDGTKHRGYDAADFETDTVAVYLEKDGRDGRDGRSQSPSHAGSTVPTEPTVLSEGCRHPVVWLARDVKRRCVICEPPHWPGEVVLEATTR
jgi:putative DNA primase/helicase